MTVYEQSRIINIATFVCIFAIVVIMYVDFRRKESFTDDHIMNYDKTILYNMNGMHNFYSSGSSASVFTTNSTNIDVVKKIIAFYSNFQDMACTSLSSDDKVTQEDTNLCRNYFVDTNSTTDNYFESLSFNETSCKNIKTIVSNSMTNSLIRVLGNYYNLMKRCIRFDDVSFERMIISSSPLGSSYYLTINGSVGPMILSRPTFISLDNYGLFNIDPVIYYDSNMKTIKLLVTRVQPYKSIKMYGTAISSISDASKTIQGMPCNIYYLNYNDKIKVTSSIDVASTLTLILSRQYLQSKAAIDVNIPTNFSNINTMVVAGSVRLLYDSKILDVTQRFSVVVAYGLPLTNIVFRLPRDMCYAIANGEDFHIVLTYSLDVMIIVCHTKNVTYFTQTPVTDGMNYVMLKYSIPAVTSVVKASGLNVEMNKHSPIVNFTAIPNFALLGKHLGYNNL